MSRVAVLQSNYMPWKGYFDIIREVDLFVFYDDVQYTKNDWRNRNRIKTPQGVQWLTIPVGANLDRLICDVTFPESRWQQKHWKSLVQCYSAAPHWKWLGEFLHYVYLERKWKTLSELNQYAITTISRTFLGFTTEFRDSREFPVKGRKQERLLDLLSQVNATDYLSGPAARDYIDAADFHARGINLVYKSYQGYPEYPQLYPPFEHNVSVLDLLVMTGADAPRFVRGQPSWSR